MECSSHGCSEGAQLLGWKATFLARRLEDDLADMLLHVLVYFWATEPRGEDAAAMHLTTHHVHVGNSTSPSRAAAGSIGTERQSSSKAAGGGSSKAAKAQTLSQQNGDRAADVVGGARLADEGGSMMC